jgi:hypothetical protein
MSKMGTGFLLQLRRFPMLVILFAVVFGLVGCSTPKEKIIARISKELDQADYSSQKWGRATVSDFTLIDNSLAPGSSNGFFALQYEQPTSFYVAQAPNVQGAITLFSAKQSSFSVAATVTPPTGNLVSAVSSATKTSSTVSTNAVLGGAAGTNATPAAANASTAASTGGTGSGSGSGAGSGAGSGSGTGAGSGAGSGSGAGAGSNASPTFITPTTLTLNAQPQLSQNTVLKIGATDKITERILNFMSDPIHLPDNKKAYLGVMQVSLLPGWRTKQGYICEVQVTFDLALSKSLALQRIKDLNLSGIDYARLPDYISSRTGTAAKLGLPVNRTISIISAFPFAEDQVLDQASSLQNQLAFLAQLAGSLPQFPALQASLKSTFSKLTQQSVATMNALPLVVPSSQGYDVTYRFNPELQALVEPGNTSSKSGQVLEPSSFPALIVIICDDKDLLTWDTLSASEETRWIPVSHRNWFKKAAYDPWRYGYGTEDAPGQMLSNEERLENAWDFDKIIDDMSSMLDAGFKANDYVSQEVVRRFEDLKTTAMGHTLDSELPPIRPYVTTVYPARFRQDFIPDDITIQGHFFQSPFTQLQFVGLQGMQLKNISISETQIEAHLPKEKIKLLVPGVYPIDLVTTAGKTTWTDAITIDPVPAPMLGSAIAKPVLEYVPDGIHHKKQNLTILGQNFVVGDKSLKVAVGGVVLPEVDDQDRSHITDQSISLDIQMKKLGLPPGKYDLTVATSGGQAVLSNAIEIDYKDLTDGDYILPPVPPLAITVYPNQFRLDFAPKTIQVVGDFFNANSSKVQYAELGGILLERTTNDSDGHSLSFTLPRNQLTATNYNFELFNEAGQTVLSNAVQILPVPAPVVTAVLPTPVKIGPYGTNVYPVFTAGDFINLPLFAKQLANTENAVSAYLTNQLTAATLAALTNYLASGSNAVPLVTNLVQSLNNLSLNALVANRLICQTNRFAAGTLRPETQTLLAQNPQGQSLQLLNRMLLEDAYPLEIATNSQADPAMLTILGQNFVVGDGSLKIAIGGVLITNPPTTGQDDQLLSFDLSTNDLKSLKVGSYELAVITSGGRGVLSNAVQIVSGPAASPKTNEPALTQVYPNHGLLFATNVFIVTGSNFLAATSQGQAPTVSNVTVGSRNCSFAVISDTVLSVTVPPWSYFESTNDLAMATNKLDIVVATGAGVATLTNAVIFNLTLPNDAKRLVPQTAVEVEAQKMADVAIYAARVMHTNLVVEPVVKSTSSAGPIEKRRDKYSVNLPGISAGIHIGSTDEHHDGYTGSGANTNAPVQTNAPAQLP